MAPSGRAWAVNWLAPVIPSRPPARLRRIGPCEDVRRPKAGMSVRAQLSSSPPSGPATVTPATVIWAPSGMARGVAKPWAKAVAVPPGCRLSRAAPSVGVASVGAASVAKRSNWRRVGRGEWGQTGGTIFIIVPPVVQPAAPADGFPAGRLRGACNRSPEPARSQPARSQPACSQKDGGRQGYVSCGPMDLINSNTRLRSELSVIR